MEVGDRMMFDRNQIKEFLIKLDEELSTEVTMLIIGGAAAMLAYESKDATKDIDTWKDEKDLNEAYARAIKKYPKLKLPLSPARVHIQSKAMLNRFVPYEELGTTKLKIKVPEPEDLFLLKAQRADEKDIDDLIELHRNQKLNPKTIIGRFQTDILPLNGGNDEALVDKYLFCIDKVFGEQTAHEHSRKIANA